VNTLYYFGVETLLPFISLDGSPNASIESFFSLVLIEVFVIVGHYFGYLIEEIDEVVLG
jgi:hypothetical protein